MNNKMVREKKTAKEYRKKDGWSHCTGFNHTLCVCVALYVTAQQYHIVCVSAIVFHCTRALYVTIILCITISRREIIMLCHHHNLSKCARMHTKIPAHRHMHVRVHTIHNAIIEQSNYICVYVFLSFTHSLIVSYRLKTQIKWKETGNQEEDLKCVQIKFQTTLICCKCCHDKNNSNTNNNNIWTEEMPGIASINELRIYEKQNAVYSRRRKKSTTCNERIASEWVK